MNNAHMLFLEDFRDYGTEVNFLYQAGISSSGLFMGQIYSVLSITARHAKKTTSQMRKRHAATLRVGIAGCSRPAAV